MSLFGRYLRLKRSNPKEAQTGEQTNEQSKGPETKLPLTKQPKKEAVATSGGIPAPAPAVPLPGPSAGIAAPGPSGGHGAGSSGAGR
jgi:hypothetical protein